jgi:aerobic-type carbon monoxide dehydrogenase small subunit (CoxS/CutS family)
VTGERLTLHVNGERTMVELDPLTPLRTVLGNILGLRSVREPCGVGACGACTVLVDGQPVKSCLAAVGLIGDAPITTTEGLSPDDPVVAAFVARGAFQCGFCIPGFVMAAHGLLGTAAGQTAGRTADGPAPPPTPEDIRAALAGNLCRCGSYGPILAAVNDVLSSEPTKPARADPR